MKLYKWLVAAALAAVAVPASAATYTLWPAGTENQIPFEWNGWWNVVPSEVSDNGTTVYKIAMENQSLTDASGGFLTTEAMTFDFTNLADKDLVFDAKIEGAGSWAIRLTGNGQESDMPVAIPADGAYHNVRFNLATDYPAVNAQWKSGDTNGKGTFTFAFVGSRLAEGSALYFNNVRYTDAIAMPQIEANISDITATTASLTYSVTFPDGYTDTKVTVNGETGSLSATESLENLTPKTEYAYTIVASGKYNGETYAAEKTVKFTTLREAGDVPVWYGTTDIPGFTADYNIAYNPDGTLTVSAVIVTEKETPVGDRNFHIFVGGDEWLKLYDDGTGTLTGTTASTFEEGSTITWEWYMPYAGGVYQQASQYVVGSENEKPAALRVKASATDITTTSAKIAYEVTGADTYKVFYKFDESAATEATANPFELTGLTSNTEYNCEIYATATVGGQDIESAHINVAFKTLREGAVDLVYNDIFETTFTNAWRAGGSADNRSDIKVALPWSVTYTAAGEGIYSIDLSEVENIVGLVPRIWSGDFKDLTKNLETGRHEYNFGPQELDAEVAISHYLSYDGGGIDVRTPYTKWGMVKEAPVSLVVKAEVAAVTSSTADINYTVTGADAFKVFYKPAEGEAVEAAESPIKLTGLTAATEYSYEVYATANVNGNDIESEHVTVTFKTLRENAVDIVYSDLHNAEFKNAFLVGEDESARRTIYTTLPWSVTYAADGTAVYSIDLSSVETVVGLVPQIYWNGFKNLTKNEATGRYEYNFGEQEFDGDVALSHYIAYSGGVIDYRTAYTKWGMEKEAPVLGEAASLTLTASATHVKAGDAIDLATVAKDANGYYVSVADVSYKATFDGQPAEITVEGNKAVIDGVKGEYKIRAVVGEIESNEVAVNIIANGYNTSLVTGLVGVTDAENVVGGSVENVTDGVEGTASQLEWDCTDTHEHYIIFDLGQQYHIETVHVLFEGAYAEDFTVTLTNTKPTELEAQSETQPEVMNVKRKAADADEDEVFTVTGTNQTRHIFENDRTKSHQYVALRTTKAGTEWGIKLQEMSVYGTDENTFTGIEALSSDDAEAPVEYFNLNGVRVDNPTPGLYIRRQGAKVIKVIVK